MGREKEKGMSLKVLILNPPVRLDDKPRNLPHGLAILANVIRTKTKINPYFLDVNGHRYDHEQVKDFIKKIDPDVVLTGGIASIYAYIVDLADMIKQITPKAKIVAGGYAVMPIPEIILKNSKIDYLCLGEGEETIVEFLNRLTKNGLSADVSDIPGLAYKQKNNDIFKTPVRGFIDDLDRQSMMPAYDLLPMDIYLSNPVVGIGRDTDMITVRGCPFKCSFCYQPWGCKPRMHSVDFIINTIQYLRKQYQIDFISFQDDEFMVDRSRVREFCKRRNQEFSDLLWSCTGRANIISHDPGIVEEMKQAGCTLISCGFESGSLMMLKKMHKQQTIADMETTIKVLRQNQMPVPASFIIGMPGETKQTAKETLDFCLRNDLPLSSLMFATPYPGTEIFDFSVATGRIKPEQIHEFVRKLGDARNFVINLTDDFTDQELIATRQMMMDQAQKNYDKFISVEQRIEKTKKIFGKLLEKAGLDQKDIEHRAKHGGMSTF